MSQNYCARLLLAIGLFAAPHQSFASTIGGWEGLFFFFGTPIAIAATFGFLVGLVTGRLDKGFKFTFYCITILFIVVCLLLGIISPLEDELGDLVLTLLIFSLTGLLPAVLAGNYSNKKFRVTKK